MLEKFGAPCAMAARARRAQTEEALAKFGRKRPRVAVGMPVTRHPPHRSVLALLTHTVLTLDDSSHILGGLTQSGPLDTDAGSRLLVSGLQVSP